MALKQLFTNPEPDRTYASAANAQTALQRAAAKLKLTDADGDVSFTIAVAPSGRFYPVILPTTDQLQLAICFAHAGICSAHC